MLKIYDPIYSVSIDGGPWKRLGDPFDTNWFVTDKDLPETELLLDDVSFQEAYNYLRDNYIFGARTCRTVFKGKHLGRLNRRVENIPLLQPRLAATHQHHQLLRHKEV